MCNNLKDTTNQVEAYDRELLTRRDALRGTCAMISRLMKAGSEAIVIQQKQQLTDEMMRCLDDQLQAFEPAITPVLIAKCKLLYILVC